MVTESGRDGFRFSSTWLPRRLMLWWLMLCWRQVFTCPETNKKFILCDYNRDGDSYRSPWYVDLPILESRESERDLCCFR